MKNLALFGAAAIASALPPVAVSAEPGGASLVIEARIPLGEVAGRIDHLAYDPGQRRLYVAELGNNSVGIVDVKAGRLLRTIKGFDEPQGIAYEPGTDAVYVANGGDGNVRLFKGEDFSPLGTISLGSDADNVRVDSITHRVYVGYGNGALAVIDIQTRKRLADIPLAGHPESFQLQPGSDFIAVNVPAEGQIAVVSRTIGRQTALWQTGDLRSNFPMLLDPERNRVISVFRRPAHLQAYQLPGGRVLAGIDTCGDADDLFLDTRRQRIYVICGEGLVESLESTADGFARAGRVVTSVGARTGLFVPEIDRLFVAVPAHSDASAAILVLRPVP